LKGFKVRKWRKLEGMGLKEQFDFVVLKKYAGPLAEDV
jgi:hypothetical protein